MTVRIRTVAIALAAAAGTSAIVLFVLLRPPRPPLPIVIRWPARVSTLAGVGAPGFAEGRGHEAAFSDPFGVAVDRAGNTWLADGGDNNLIWRIDAVGHAVVVAGGQEAFADGEGRTASFDTPSGIAFDAAGNLLVADTGNNAIRRVSPSGAVTTLAGGGGAGHVDAVGLDARFDGPVGVAVAPDGAVVVADTYNDCIRRIAPDRTVTTLAGGAAPGLRDGAAREALFDTPSGVAVDGAGVIYVADTGNDAIRRIGPDGQVTTIGAATGEGAPLPVNLFRPIGIAARPRLSDEIPAAIFVTDAAGRVLALEPSGQGRVLVERGARPRSPTGVGVAPDGSLRVADSANYNVCRVTAPGDAVPADDIDFTPVPLLTAATLHTTDLPWPVDPQRSWHEIAATVGEARGSVGGDSRERLHTGIDVRAPIGTVVRAVRDEKIESPVSATGFGSPNESLRAGLVAYVHVRVGRTAAGQVLDTARFTLVADETGQPVRIRIRRGTRLGVGDPVGTVNNFAHVHLTVGPHDAEINPLSLRPDGFHDAIPPTIPPGGIALYTETGERVPVPRKGPSTVTGRLAIVVEAYDRVDGNDARRRLGVYRLAYQVLRPDGTAAPGFEQPRATIEFDRLPDEPASAPLIYAEGSGITVYGSRTTRFRYIVTNSLREGHVTQALWDTTELPAGDYRLRVLAADFSGNETTRDLPVRVQ